MLVSVQEVQNHIEDLRKDLASAVKRAQFFRAIQRDLAQRDSNEAKRSVVSLRRQIKALTMFKKIVAARDA